MRKPRLVVLTFVVTSLLATTAARADYDGGAWHSCGSIVPPEIPASECSSHAAYDREGLRVSGGVTLASALPADAPSQASGSAFSEFRFERGIAEPADYVAYRVTVRAHRAHVLRDTVGVGSASGFVGLRLSAGVSECSCAAYASRDWSTGESGDGEEFEYVLAITNAQGGFVPAGSVRFWLTGVAEAILFLAGGTVTVDYDFEISSVERLG